MKKREVIFDETAWIGKNATESDLLVGCSTRGFGLVDLNFHKGYKRDWRPEEWPPRKVRVIVMSE